ncbi:hypothetical protein GF362_03285 [Candidatus Dojkabacteria bacterium]|nr:hypothetical protein [Candidatus Dojkabacteria bacterium]
MSNFEAPLFQGGDTDFDQDGLTYDQELTFGTDPNLWDTDGDGLSDAQEVLGWVNVGDYTRYFTSDPTLWDSDGDGLSDGWEVKYGPYSDPNEVNYHKSDADKDGLSDYDEKYVYGTDPFHNDTDRDGLSDGDEVVNAKRVGEVNIYWDADPLDAYSNGDQVYNVETEQWESLTDGQAARCMPYGETACLIGDTNSQGYPPSSFIPFNRETAERGLQEVSPTPTPEPTVRPTSSPTTGEQGIQMAPAWCDKLGPWAKWVPGCR